MSNFSAAQMAQVSKFGPITSLQPPYSMIRPEVEHAELPYCLANHIGVIAYSPMASGLLTGAMTRERIAAMPADDWRKEKNRHYQEPLLTRNLNLVELLKAIGARYGRTPGEVAVDIAPLFESVDALEHCGSVMRTLLGDPIYRRHLEARGRTQCVALGYSDANKESGICASMLSHPFQPSRESKPINWPRRALTT